MDLVDRYLRGRPLIPSDAKNLRNFILRRSLLLEGGRRGPLAEMVNVSRSAGRTPMALIAIMISIDTLDFTSPDLPSTQRVSYSRDSVVYG